MWVCGGVGLCVCGVCVMYVHVSVWGVYLCGDVCVGCGVVVCVVRVDGCGGCWSVIGSLCVGGRDGEICGEHMSAWSVPEVCFVS